MATIKKRSHYRPHERIQEDGAIINFHTGQVVYPPSMTKQEFIKECDINNILKQYSVTGMLKHVSANAASGTYSDLPDAFDFQESLHQVEAARTAFMTLPAKLRARFDNEPAQFLAFCADPQNLDELRTLGLANPAPPPTRPPEEKPSQEATKPPPKAKGGDGEGM